MKYTCDCINSLFFDYNCVKCGCSNTFGKPFIFPFKGNDFDIEKINIERTKIVNSFKVGVVPEECKKCYMLREDTDGELDKPLTKELSDLYISHWYHCNCACIYCCNRDVTKLKMTTKKKKSDYYDLFPAIKSLCEGGYIGENTRITTIGGEPSVLSEFDEIMNELIKYTKAKIIILSNGIKYSDGIYKVLKHDNTEVDISLDAGNAELYRKIKGVDAFEQVIENITKYIKANPKNNKSVVIKYIMIEGLNDKKEYLEQCINLVKEIGIKKMILSMDYNCNHIGKKIPKHWHDLYDYFLSVKDIETITSDYYQQILDKNEIF